jgi:hypothetical protein
VTSISYAEIIIIARGLIESEALAEGLENQYTRGVVELIALSFGLPGVFLSERKLEVLTDLRRVKA